MPINNNYSNLRDVCQNLRQQGLSLNEIAKITKRPKTTVYFHIRNLTLPPEVKEKALRAAKERIVNFNHSRGKSALNRRPKIFKKWTLPLVCLVGHFIFDGEVDRVKCVYTNRSRSLVSRVKSSMRLIYDFKPKEKESTLGVFRISYNNVELALLLKSKIRELVAQIPKASPAFKREFLRSFFDDEGSVYFIKNKRLVRGFQHNLSMLNLIQNLLNDFGIKSRVDGKYNEIVIGGRSNIQKFAKEINFSPGVCVNGDRSNSVWKKSLEKREILGRALGSYRNQ